MTALPKHKMTVAEFLPWAAAQERGRYELVRGEVVAQAAERARHNIVKKNVARALDDAVRRAGKTLTVFTSGITVVIDNETSYEPDAAVQCGGTIDLDSLVCERPLIVVEVASPSSEKADATGKLADYMTLASVAHVLIIDPVRRIVLHHARGEGPRIDTRILREGDTLAMTPPGLELRVVEFFDHV